MNPRMRKQYWCIRMDGGRYLNDVEKHGFIAIGSELPDLSWLKRLSKEEARKRLMDLYKQMHPDATRRTIGVNCTQLLNFVVNMKRGDIVLTPGGNTILISEIISDYYYDESPVGECQYKHRRKVRVLKKVERKDIPERLRSALRAWQTVFNLDKYGEYIEELISGEPTPEEFIIGPSVSDILADRLLDLSPRFFQEKLIPSLLRAMGFEAEATPTYQGDQGIDVSGHYKMGVFEGYVRIQVKRVKQPISTASIRELRGSLRHGQTGIFITTSRFSKEAKKEADDITKPGGKITLVDGRKLSELILQFYDRLDEEVRRELEKQIGLKRSFIIRKRGKYS